METMSYQVAPPRTLEERRKERRDRVVAVYSKIYGIAKVVFEILKAYGVEVCDSSPGSNVDCKV
jgi:hypothetical protein